MIDPRFMSELFIDSKIVMACITGVLGVACVVVVGLALSSMIILPPLGISVLGIAAFVACGSSYKFFTQKDSDLVNETESSHTL